MDLGLRGKRALVTAASRGLGRASARALALEGARVAPTSRSAEAMQGLAAEIAATSSGEALPLAMDLLDPVSIEQGVRTVVDRWGGIDILVGNTPGPASGPFVSIDPGTWREAIDMTIMAMVNLLRPVIPVMRAGGGGRILLITTVGVKIAQPHMVLSNATRLAILGIAKTLSIELAADNILVNAICPGPIDTDRMTELVAATSRQRNISEKEAEAIWLDEVPLARMGRAEDFGKLVAMLVSDVSSYVTGAALAVDGGKSRAY